MSEKPKGKSPIQAQADKLFKHTRSGSYGTRARYRGSCKQFLSFVHEAFKMKNLRNLQDKHVVALSKQGRKPASQPKRYAMIWGRYATCMIWFLMPNMNWLPIMSWKSSMD
ncbi:hypothetical protein [Lentibacillus cibarius]|uniref:Core-binding (CB) domain-containing protein n=1 Tax=Lentibacillus cibarius TaxID=2583219 RepID=A0A5S3QFV5_9BACI|nr:hypothetical protein [Lentibacillus cibarius]TMN18786.1 hypothetical protein FFL34_17685 [Lentibacillus cibarius]